MEIGDFGFYEFELSQIKEIKDGKIYSVSNGHIEITCFNAGNSWFSLSLRNKVISDYFEYYNNELRYMVDLWENACNATTNESTIKYENKLKTFFNETIKLCENTKNSYVDNIRVIGR